MKSSKTASRVKSNEAYIPVIDIRAPHEFSLAEQANNFDLIGLNALHDLGLFGKGRKIGIIDSGGPAGMLQKNFVKGELDHDMHGHGTHVTSVLRKIAPQAQIVMAKAMGKTGGGNIDDLLFGTEWLVKQGCTEINGSFAFNEGTNTKAYEDLIDWATDQGVIFAFASGNEGASKVSFPSNRDNVFSVGAVNRNGEIANFSNQGKDIDLVAPGKDIMGDSLVPGRQILMSGTSQATPHVTGMISLYVEYMLKKGGKKPDFFKAYSDITKHSTKDLGKTGFDNAYGYGLIKPYFAGVTDDDAQGSGGGLFANLFRFLNRLFG